MLDDSVVILPSLYFKIPKMLFTLAELKIKDIDPYNIDEAFSAMIDKLVEFRKLNLHIKLCKYDETHDCATEQDLWNEAVRLYELNS